MLLVFRQELGLCFVSWQSYLILGEFLSDGTIYQPYVEAAWTEAEEEDEEHFTHFEPET